MMVSCLILIWKPKKLLEENLSITEIADIRNLAQSTIMNHISRLQTQFSDLPIEHIRSDTDEQMIDNVQQGV